MKKTKSIDGRIPLKSVSVVIVSALVAFGFGIQTAGDFDPVIGSIRADGAVIEGDLNGSGGVDIGDAILALEISLQYRTPTIEELHGDPNGDFRITAEDALEILTILSRTSED